MKKIVVFLLLVSSLFPSGCSRPKQYADYSRHSGFDRTEIDSATLRNLEVLGRVWGFVKYHHPAFSDDRYDLDFELFELLPLIADTAPAARNEILAQWIDGFGRYKTTPEKYEKILASDSVFEHRTDIGWIRDTATLGRELSERLVRLRSADRTAGNRYVSQTYYETYDQWSPNPCFDGEKPYYDLSNPDYGYRLLTVFRFWNMVEYFFPSKYLTDKDWNDVLPEYIRRMAHPAGSYLRETRRMIAELDDNHAQYGGGISELFGLYRVPLNTGFVEGRLIVVTPDTVPVKSERKAPFQVGDEIVAVEDKPVEYYMAQTREFISCSNGNDVLAATADQILRTKENRPLSIRYRRDGVTRDTLADVTKMPGHFGWNYLWKYHKTFSMLEDSIGYICPNKLSKEEEIPEISNGLKKNRGLIIDLRYYPSQDFNEFVSQYIVPDSVKYTVRFTYPDLALPGVFYARDYSYPTYKTEKYNAPIIIMVNEGTQSYGETSVQKIQNNPYTITIGSQSAGANGNISKFTLPRGILGAFSGLGWYYPDGWVVNRQGVKIDHEIRPTLEGIRDGRDEMLEAALRLIEEKTEEE